MSDGADRPLIAVSSRRLAVGTIQGWREPAIATNTYYLDALHRAGAQEAVLMPVELGDDDAIELLDCFDGLMLTGGDDLDPATYDQDPHPELVGVDPVADAFELALARAAIDEDVPLLAICRGIQVLNVALGGTLDQHITGRPGLVPHGAPHVGAAVHPVNIEPGTRLHAAMGVSRPECSSHHHQALDELGDGLVPVAWAEDDLVEGVELEDPDSWVVGVQWHPEDTAADDPDQQALFDGFVAEITA